MIKRIKNIFTSPQRSVFSAASVIMTMVVASRILGLVRQRTLAHFFAPTELSLFFAAFRLPDLIFEVLVFGTFSAAFIPVFTKTLKKGKREAWETAGKVANISLIIFGLLAILIGIFAKEIYSFVAPGYTKDQIATISGIARILFSAQAFFVVSYVLTGVLESLRRFFVPALSPLFYNLGIIVGTIVLTPRFGIYAPAIGVVIGASIHFLIQLPLAINLGFKFVPSIKPNKSVKEIAKLSVPRVIDLSAEQVQKTAELFLASLISSASYTYFTFASSLQLVPISLFGTSIAKASLPTLSRYEDNTNEFSKIFFTVLYQILFLVFPIAVIFLVLRIPLVRLIFGSHIFDWESTVQTGLVLSAFAVSIIFQSAIALLERAFYALHDTKTPVTVSLFSISLMVLGDFILVKGLSLPVWALAVSYSSSVTLQAIILFCLLSKRLKFDINFKILSPLLKFITASVFSGGTMYFLLKFFDRSVWVKRLSFLGKIEATSSIHFDKFVIDTRYTFNLFMLTLAVSVIGMAIYLIISFFLRSEELKILFKIIGKKGRALVLKEVPTEDLTQG